MTGGDEHRQAGDMPGAQLPMWSDGTVAVLSTIGSGMVHAIPISTALRAGPQRIVFALSRRRGSLERLRDDPHVALTVLGAGNVAFTAHGTATVARESLAVAENVAAIALSVERISDHARNDSHVLAGVRWRWLDTLSGARDGQIMAELRSMAVARDDAGPPAAEACEQSGSAEAKVARPPTLVVLDVQNGFVNERTRSVLPMVSKLIEHWQAKRWPVVFTRFHNPNGSGYERWLGWTALRTNEDIALHESVAPYADSVVDKTVYTAFTRDGDKALSVHPGDTLVICGIDTDSCVLKTALDAFERDVEPVVAIDACATDGGETAQQAARMVLERALGPDHVMATADVIARFRTA